MCQLRWQLREAITLSETAVPVTVDYDHNNGPIYYFVNLESGMFIKFQDKHGTIEYIEYTVTAELLTKILIFLEYNGYVCDSMSVFTHFLSLMKMVKYRINTYISTPRMDMEAYKNFGKICIHIILTKSIKFI